jgi:transcriptional regulator with XRE-family HTH domain
MLSTFVINRDALLKCHFILFAKIPPSRAYPVSITTLGDHIRKKRLDAKLLQKDVAGILGVDTMTINNWEKNRCNPRLYLFPKIAQFLGYNPFPTEAKHTIGEAIRAYRLTHGLSRKKLANVLRIDPTTLARWENGKSKPGALLKRRLAKFLDISDDGILQKTPTATDRGPLS